MSKKKFNETVQEEEIEQNSEVIENVIEHMEICKARYDNGLMYINFKGYGLIYPAIRDKKGVEEVAVYYEGEIGKPNFKFRV